jgi:hypothetical protein
MSEAPLDLQQKLASLEDALTAKLPGIATLLRDIHAQLKADSAIVTVLSEEECATIVRGLKKQTATEITTTALKKKPTKSLKSMSVADL